MKKIILRINPQTNLIEDIGESYITIPDGYIEVELINYPNDLMCGCYKFINGKINKEDELYAEYLETLNKGEE